jgi:hypothetical protein
MIAATALFLAAACSNVTTRQGEGLYCSSSSSENPNYVCDPARGLSCVTTYTVTQTRNNTERQVPAFICRTPCSLGDGGAACPVGDDVCCPGKTTDGKPIAACVPSQFCAALPKDEQDASAPVRRDGGADGKPADGGADAGAPDAPNAPTDAAAPDAPAAADAAPDA